MMLPGHAETEMTILYLSERLRNATIHDALLLLSLVLDVPQGLADDSGPDRLVNSASTPMPWMVDRHKPGSYHAAMKVEVLTLSM